MKKALLIVSLLLVFVACKKGTTKVMCNTPSIVSFKNDIQPIFNANCNTSGCHSGNKAAGNLKLESANVYAILLDSKSGYIDTLHPENSILYVSMTSKTNPMPPSGKLDECVTGLILKWIQQGAKNN